MEDRSSLVHFVRFVSKDKGQGGRDLDVEHKANHGYKTEMKSREFGSR